MRSNHTPYILRGANLAAGTVIAHPGQATETLDVSGLGAIRLRVQTSADADLTFAFHRPLGGAGAPTTGHPPTRRLTGGVEALVEVPVTGEERLSVTLATVGGNTTVDRIDIYPVPDRPVTRLLPDLQQGVSRHLVYTITLAATDYAIEIPDSAQYLTLYSSAALQYAIDEASAAPTAKAGAVAESEWGAGGRYAAAGQVVTHVLPPGRLRVLHVQSAVAGAVVELGVH
jgi:hypothetical protein